MKKKLLFLVFSLFFISLIYADVISVNSGGSKNVVITPGANIEDFFSQVDRSPSLSQVFINSTNGTNKTAEDLNCFTNLSDEDNDTMNVSVRWYMNDSLYLTLDYNNNYENGSFFNSVLLSGNTSKNEIWKCSVRTYDGTYYSNWTNSSGLTILNTLPIVNLISPENYNVTTNRNPTFFWNATDADGDSLIYQVKRNGYTSSGSPYSDDDEVITLSSENYTWADYFKYLKDNNYYYNWSVRASDDNGITYGDWAPERKIEFQSSPSIILLNDKVDFGVINMSGSKNTTTDSPEPFLLENNGNCFLNITLNSSQLWDSVSGDSDYYEYKTRNNSAEPGSFDWENSKTNWTDVPINWNGFAIAMLNWNDSKDSAKTDLLVIDPPQEPAGPKQSHIIFTASLGE